MLARWTVVSEKSQWSQNFIVDKFPTSEQIIFVESLCDKILVFYFDTLIRISMAFDLFVFISDHHIDEW